MPTDRACRVPGGGDVFEGDDDWRILPATAAHVRAALLSLHPTAEILLDDEDDVEVACEWPIAATEQ